MSQERGTPSAQIHSNYVLSLTGSKLGRRVSEYKLNTKDLRTLTRSTTVLPRVHWILTVMRCVYDGARITHIVTHEDVRLLGHRDVTAGS